MYICIYVYTYRRVKWYASIYKHTYIYVHIYISTHTYIYTYRVLCYMAYMIYMIHIIYYDTIHEIYDHIWHVCRAGLDTSSKERLARPRDIPHVITRAAAQASTPPLKRGLCGRVIFHMWLPFGESRVRRAFIHAKDTVTRYTYTYTQTHQNSTNTNPPPASHLSWNSQTSAL